MDTTRNYGLKKPGADDFYNIEDFNNNADKLDTVMKEISNVANNAELNSSLHAASKGNPHEVTKEQVGLGNVPNVTTNNQTPTYVIPGAIAEMTSGENLSVALGKVAKFIKDGINHFDALDTKVSENQKNAGIWVGPQIIESGESSKDIINNAIDTTSIIDVYYDEAGKEEVQNAVPSYLQTAGKLKICFENPVGCDVTIQNIRVVNV